MYLQHLSQNQKSTFWFFYQTRTKSFSASSEVVVSRVCRSGASVRGKAPAQGVSQSRGQKRDPGWVPPQEASSTPVSSLWGHAQSVDKGWGLGTGGGAWVRWFLALFFTLVVKKRIRNVAIIVTDGVFSSNISTLLTWNGPLKSLKPHFLLPGSDVSWRPHPGRLLRSSSAACCQQEVARSSSSFLPLSPSASRNLGKGGKLKQSVSLWKALPLISAETNLRGHSVHSPFGLLLEFRWYRVPIPKRHVCNISWLLN